MFVPASLLRYCQGQAKPAEEFGEVGVDDGLVVLAEAAGRLAGGEAEDRGTDQAFGPGDLGLGRPPSRSADCTVSRTIRAAGVTAGLVSSSGKTAGCLRAVSLIPAASAARRSSQRPSPGARRICCSPCRSRSP